MALVKKKGHGSARIIDDSKLSSYLANGYEVVKPPKKNGKNGKPDENGKPDKPGENGGEGNEEKG